MADSFDDFLHELFESLGGVSFRRMFGGVGIFREGLMFALVADDILYLKADDESRRAFADEDSTPFSFASRGKEMVTSYWRLPERLYDDPDAFRAWATTAFDVAVKANKVKRRTQRKKSKPRNALRKA